MRRTCSIGLKTWRRSWSTGASVISVKLRRSSCRAARIRSRQSSRGARGPARRRCRKAATPASSAAPLLRQTGLRSSLSLKRMRQIRAVDAANGTLTAEAGCTMVEVQDAARASGQLFPLSLAAEGSATIGGNLSHQRRRRAGPAIWQCARTLSRSRSSAAERRGLERAARPAQGQHRLRPARSFHRCRGYARRHHRGLPEDLPAATRASDRTACRACAARCPGSAAGSRGPPADRR